jgi:flagellar FliL protein
MMSRIEDALAKASKLRQGSVTSGNGPEPASPPPAEPPTESGGWRYAVGVLLIVVAGFGMYRFGQVDMSPSQPKPKAAAVSEVSHPQIPKPTPAKPLPQKNCLPGCIPVNSPDTAYAASHPGWQRYKAKSMEFRVFRKQGAVKVIQVLSHQKDAINGALLSSLLSEATGSNTFKIQSGANREGYYIEKGKAGVSAEVVIYRKKQAGEIRGVVVAYL